MSVNTIFVQIASYRDPQLIPTLKDLISNSKHPELLKIVVCWQHGNDETLEDFNNEFEFLKTYTEDVFPIHEYVSENGASIKFIDVHYQKTKGCCWARNLIQQYYNEEKYTLQLDSHHRFVENVDTILVDMLESVREESEFKKPLLTAYLPSFDPEADPSGRVLVPWKMDFDRFIPEGAVFFIPSSIDDWKSRNGKPMRARFYSGHFCFADGIFATEVSHPDLFFHGEEINISARAYTHGYDLFHPTIQQLIWHEYTRKNRIHVWSDHVTQEKIKGNIEMDWVERNNISHKKNRIFFGMDGEDSKQIDFGKCGFGTKRTLKEYEEYTGISFKYRGVQQYTLNKNEPIIKHKSYDSEEEWKNTLLKSNDHRILLHKKTDLMVDVNDYDFWYIAVHDKDDQEIFRKDKIASEIKELLNNSGEWLDFRFIYLSNRIAMTYTVWPHSSSMGWIKKITKEIHDKC